MGDGGGRSGDGGGAWRRPDPAAMVVEEGGAGAREAHGRPPWPSRKEERGRGRSTAGRRHEGLADLVAKESAVAQLRRGRGGRISPRRGERRVRRRGGGGRGAGCAAEEGARRPDLAATGREDGAAAGLAGSCRGGARRCGGGGGGGAAAGSRRTERERMMTRRRSGGGGAAAGEGHVGRREVW
ncbi:hypothetical protein BS78_02G050600, partial [Paspalum vaginatum]